MALPKAIHPSSESHAVKSFPPKLAGAKSPRLEEVKSAKDQ